MMPLMKGQGHETSISAPL